MVLCRSRKMIELAVDLEVVDIGLFLSVSASSHRAER